VAAASTHLSSHDAAGGASAQHVTSLPSPCHSGPDDDDNDNDNNKNNNKFHHGIQKMNIRGFTFELQN
jgi:hypothetical protein